jgi:hypothetical protein
VLFRSVHLFENYLKTKYGDELPQLVGFETSIAWWNCVEVHMRCMVDCVLTFCIRKDKFVVCNMEVLHNVDFRNYLI